MAITIDVTRQFTVLLFSRLPPSPEGEWWEMTDEASGVPYYYHTKTGETVWERPQTFVIPLSVLQVRLFHVPDLRRVDGGDYRTPLWDDASRCVPLNRHRHRVPLRNRPTSVRVPTPTIGSPLPPLFTRKLRLKSAGGHNPPHVQPLRLTDLRRANLLHQILHRIPAQLGQASRF